MGILWRALIQSNRFLVPGILQCTMHISSIIHYIFINSNCRTWNVVVDKTKVGATYDNIHSAVCELATATDSIAINYWNSDNDERSLPRPLLLCRNGNRPSFWR